MKHAGLFMILLSSVNCDNNILTGANDILAVVGVDGEIKASPFSVQFGKKDIWLPRLGHSVSLTVNNQRAPFSMVLDAEGRGYFPTKKSTTRQYRFWSALLGFGQPNNKLKTNSASPEQLSWLNLGYGQNNLTYMVAPDIGKPVAVDCKIYLVDDTKKIVITDIDGTITKSNVPGLILPVLGLSDWKHNGVVNLYNRITDQGYLMLYLTNRAIGQSSMTRSYLDSLLENGETLPQGPLLLQVDSALAALQREVFSGGHPEMNKIAALSRIRGLFSSNPFRAGFGNKPWDTITYKALGIPEDKIYKVDEDSNLFNEGTGETSNYDEIINNIYYIFPQ